MCIEHLLVLFLKPEFVQENEKRNILWDIET